MSDNETAQVAPVAAVEPAAADTSVSTAQTLQAKPLAGQSKEENKAAFLATLAAAKAPSGGEQAAVDVDVPAVGAEMAATTQAATVEAEVPPAAVAEDDPAAAALLKLARENRRIQESQRKIREERAANEKWLTQERAGIAKAKERDELLTAARNSGDPIKFLKAAGLTDEQLDGSWLVDALMEAGKRGEPPAPKYVTEEQAIAALKAQQEKEAADAKAQQDARIAAELAVNRDKYFSGVATELKSGQYPRVQAIRPTMGELDAAFVAHHRATGERLTQAQLLGAFERAYEARGIVVAPKVPKVAPRPAGASATRTITVAVKADAGTLVAPSPDDKPRSLTQLRAEGRAAAVAAVEAKNRQQARR